MYGFGIAAFILGVIGAIPYIRDTYKRKTKPHRIAWLIFLILSIISFASQATIGATPALFFYAWTIINNVIIFSLSLRKNNGYGGMTKLDISILVLAVVSIILWQLTSSAIVALIFVLIAEAIGASIIVVKTWKHPQSETMIMWVLGGVASIFTMLAVGEWDIFKLAAPFQLFVFNCLIVGAYLAKRRKKKRP